jgi:uncharacterized cupredoxin-like copper-binding protein
MKKYLFVWIILSSMALVSCGGGRAAKVTTEIDVTMTDFQFSPNSFTVPAGQDITLNASNTGGVVHSFVIMQKGKSAGTEYNDEDLPNVFWEVEIQPNVSTETSFVAPGDPGEYEVVCHIPGHLQAGMVGKLNVVADE